MLIVVKLESNSCTFPKEKSKIGFVLTLKESNSIEWLIKRKFISMIDLTGHMNSEISLHKNSTQWKDLVLKVVKVLFQVSK